MVQTEYFFLLIWRSLIQGPRLQISRGYNLACKASTLYIFMKQCSVHLYQLFLDMDTHWKSKQSHFHLQLQGGGECHQPCTQGH